MVQSFASWQGRGEIAMGNRDLSFGNYDNDIIYFICLYM